MADKDNQDKSTEDQDKKDEVQTVPIEQFEELEKKFESLMKAQSGSDNKVTDLLKQMKQNALDRENEKKTADQINSDEIAELKKAIEQERIDKIYAVNKGLASQTLIDADLKVPRTIDRLIGKTEEETLKYVKLYIEDRQEDHATAKDIEAKKYGRKVVDTTQKSVEKMSYEDMAKLSDEKFNAIPKELVNKAMDAALGAKK